MGNLAIVESGLINVYGTETQDEVIVSGRELHGFLEVGTQYTKWFDRMVEYGFVENVDYIAVSQKRLTAQKNQTTYTDHHLKMDMAKEVSMIQRTDKGKMARLYFIEAEKKYKVLTVKSPTTLESLQAMINNMVEQERRTSEIESKVVHIQDHLTASPDNKTIERQINTYARRNNMHYQDVRVMIYNKIEDLHGVDIMQRVKNKRDKIQKEKINRTGKPYAQSTMKTKANGMHIIAELDLMGEVMKILAGM